MEQKGIGDGGNRPAKTKKPQNPGCGWGTRSRMVWELGKMRDGSRGELSSKAEMSVAWGSLETELLRCSTKARRPQAICFSFSAEVIYSRIHRERYFSFWFLELLENWVLLKGQNHNEL